MIIQGPYNANIKEKLEKICTPDVVKYVDMASKTLNEEDFNDFVNYIFENELVFKDLKTIAKRTGYFPRAIILKMDKQFKEQILNLDK